MKKRLKDEENETVTNCNVLKMTAEDGKKRLTDVANTEQLLRIIHPYLRDNMSTLELVLNMLAEATTTELSKEQMYNSKYTFSERLICGNCGALYRRIAWDAG